MFGLGMQELLIILFIAMLLFGGKRLPEVGRNLGKAIRGFKESEEETARELREAEQRKKETEKGSEASAPEKADEEDEKVHEPGNRAE